MPRSAGPPLETLIGHVEKQIPMWLEESRVPGLSIAIIKDAKLAWRRGFGVKVSGSKEPVDNDTMFEAASMSKPVFAYVVMKLVEKGVMNLDTPLTRYTSERFLKGDPRLELITARHALSHTSGFQDWRSGKEPLKIHFTPGEKWLYSGEGYYYLQSVVTHLTGRVDLKDCARFEADLEVCATDIDTFIEANLFVPLGMHSSGYFQNDTFARRMAQPHDATGKPLESKKASRASMTRYASAGALITTPTDYAKFLIEVIDPSPTDAFRLRKESYQEMLRPHVKLEGQYPSSWALGWQIFHNPNRDFIYHGGDNAGFHCGAIASVAGRCGYVVMTNGDDGPDVLKKLVTDDLMQQFLVS
jgi:CubicO group peptidase (beta-lactamase class C family)